MQIFGKPEDLRKRLSTSANRGQVLSAGKTLVGDQVLQESLDVAVEVGDLVDGNEGEDGGAAVGSLVELEAVAGKSHGCDG